MENETFRSRVANLMNRSRKALRLYSNVGRMQPDSPREFTEGQTKEWKHITSELLKDLSVALEKTSSTKQLISDVYLLRDKYSSQWRSLEAELHSKQKELISAAEQADFSRCAGLSNALVLQKSRMQAAQAAHNELQEVIQRSKVAQPTIELSAANVLADDYSSNYPFNAGEPTPKGKALRKHISLGDSELGGANAVGARVIPLRKLL